MSFIRDTLLVFRRQERLALRQPAWVIIGLTQPILYLALFGPLLKGLPGASLGGGGNAYRFFVPGLLIQLALFGSTFVGFAIISDWRSGVIERFRVTPVNRLASWPAGCCGTWSRWSCRRRCWCWSGWRSGCGRRCPRC